ncbi:hypothetical protein OMK68_19835 [Rhodococcus pyridinivorans]|uniref:hypothetical protein n=1 Tax=Rhodococcus pyridinivorans TaxID=103816 RepID=UPI0022280BE6|nr:hypothetical protein [Rhodococcus pyridinivorans]MCW3471858.1 hypothetical protein [Rhodococcus pyridinivorans]
MIREEAVPTLLVYKEIVPGDVRKLLGESNDAKTGGGARDLRFPAKPFGPVMRRIFTIDAVGKNERPIKIANVMYLDASGKIATTPLEYWPATTARPTEDRIAKVHASPALGGKTPDTTKGRIFVLFSQFSNGMVRCDYAYEDDLRRNGLWAQEVRDAVLGCLTSTDMKNSTRTVNLAPVQGYYDFTNGARYCHAD